MICLMDVKILWELKLPNYTIVVDRVLYKDCSKNKQGPKMEDVSSYKI